MKVKLKQDNYYISETGSQKFGHKGQVVNIDPLFHKHITLICEIVADKEEKEPEEKPLNKMNKDELVEKAKEVGLDYSDEDYEKFTKADITKLIQEKINA